MHELALANYAETFMSSDSFEMQKKIDAVEPAGIDLAGRAAAYLLDNLDGRVSQDGLPRKIRHAGISLV